MNVNYKSIGSNVLSLRGWYEVVKYKISRKFPSLAVIQIIRIPSDTAFRRPYPLPLMRRCKAFCCSRSLTGEIYKFYFLWEGRGNKL